MDAIVPWVAPMVGLLLVGSITWQVRPWASTSDRKTSTTDRLRLIAQGAEVVAILAIVSFIGTWTTWSMLGWYALISVAACAAVGLTLRAASAPWIAPGAARRTRVLATALSLAISAAFVVVPLAL